MISFLQNSSLSNFTKSLNVVTLNDKPISFIFISYKQRTSMENEKIIEMVTKGGNLIWSCYASILSRYVQIFQGSPLVNGRHSPNYFTVFSITVSTKICKLSVYHPWVFYRLNKIVFISLTHLLLLYSKYYSGDMFRSLLSHHQAFLLHKIQILNLF
jgi:hypothetical protein